MARVRAWCFTIFECSNENLNKLNDLDCVYLIAGDEVAPTTGRVHWQCYAYFANAKKFATIKNTLPEGSHIEPAKGNAEQNRRYCSKEKILLEKGELPKQGKRNDMTAVKECIKDGGNMRELTEITMSFQALRFGETLLKYNERVRNFKPHVQWFWGPSGTGKSKKAHELFPDAWWSGKNLQWWQGYDAHEDVIIDDFRGDFCTFHELLRILDRYPYTIEVKGSSRQLLAKNIVITSCYPPERVYTQSREHLCQLIRRIDEIIEFKASDPLDTEDTEVGGNTIPRL